MMIGSDYAVPAKEVKKVEAGTDNALMGMDEIGNFIKLFVAQMENQDPMNPADGSEFFSQTAQITTVEQLVSMNKRNESMQTALDSLDRSLTSAYLGRMVTGTGFDADDRPAELEGVVMGVSYGEGGKVTLALDSGAELSLKDVTSISVYTGN